MTTKPKRRKRPSQLYSYRPDEISVVDEGANGKRILITKRRQTMRQKATKQKLEKMVIAKMAATPAQVRARVEKAVKMRGGVRVVKVADAPDDDDDTQAVDKAKQPLSEQAQAALEAMGRLIAPYAEEITAADLVSVGNAAGVKEDTAADDAAPAGDAVDMEAEDDDDVLMEADPGDPDWDEEQAESDADELGDEDDDPGPEDDDDPPDDMPVVTMPDEEPAPPPPVPPEAPDGISDELHDEAAQAARAAYASTLEAKGYRVMKSKRGSTGTTTSQKDDSKMGRQEQALLQRIEKRAIKMERVNKQLEERNSKLERDLAIERNARLEREYQARAERDFGHVGEPEKIAKALRQAHERLGKDGAAELEAILKSANGRLEAAQEMGGGLFGEIGSRLGADDKDPENRLQAMTDEIVQKSAGSQDRRSPSQVYRDNLRSKEGRKMFAETIKKRNRVATA